MLAEGKVDVRPLITGRVQLERVGKHLKLIVSPQS